MKRLISVELALLTLVCVICAAAGPLFGAEAEKAKEPAVEAVSGPSTVVGRIGPYSITREELEKQYLMALRPDEYDYYDEQSKPATVREVLEDMVAEKAIMLEARKQGGLEEERTAKLIKKFRERRLANLLAQNYLKDKVTSSESEIAQKMKTDPKLDKARAKAMVERDKAKAIWEKYYKDIHKRLNVKKIEENFPTAIQAHHRLLYRPRTARSVGFIRNSQVRDELSPEEKATVLATYDKGQVTLEDWFVALCDIVPPRRPRNMKDPKVFDQLLESALQMPLLVVEAESLGLHKNEELLKQVRDYEDRILAGNARVEQTKGMKEPTAEEIKAYFEKNKEQFGTSKSVKLDQIWCDSLTIARKAKAALDEGTDGQNQRHTGCHSPSRLRLP